MPMTFVATGDPMSLRGRVVDMVSQAGGVVTAQSADGVSATWQGKKKLFGGNDSISVRFLLGPQGTQVIIDAKGARGKAAAASLEQSLALGADSIAAAVGQAAAPVPPVSAYTPAPAPVPAPAMTPPLPPDKPTISASGAARVAIFGESASKPACPSCDTPAYPDALYCHRCGMKLPECSPNDSHAVTQVAEPGTTAAVTQPIPVVTEPAPGSDPTIVVDSDATIAVDAEATIVEDAVPAGPVGVLELTIGDGDPMTLEFSEEGRAIVLGRDSSADVVVTDPRVSRRHLSITLISPGAYVLEDLGTTNGTFLNGARMDRAERLADGSVLEFGRSRAVVRMAD